MALLIRYGRVCLLSLWMALGAPWVAEAALSLQEQEIKAGLLYNFLKYTEWPETEAEKATPLTVCVFGQDPFGKYLEPMAGRSVSKRSIVLRLIETGAQAQTCHMLFINASEEGSWPQLRQALQGLPVLTVSDLKEFSVKGGMIEFSRRGVHISADINLSAVTAARLQVQERLLKLVNVMRGDPAPEGGPP